MLCYPRLNKGVLDGNVEDDLKKMLDIVKDVRISLGRRDSY